MKMKALAALGLVFCLSLPALGSPILGEEITPPDITTRGEEVGLFYETLKSIHPNLYTVVPESEFIYRVEELSETADEMDEFTYAANLQSIAAMAGDSHTKAVINPFAEHFYLFNIMYYDEKPLLGSAPKEYEEYLGKEITEINGVPLDEVYERLTEIASYDNPVHMNRQVRQMAYYAEILDYIGVCDQAEDITVTVMDTEPVKIPLSPLSLEDNTDLSAFVTLRDMRETTPVTEVQSDKNYFAQPLNDSVYYIQYNVCAEDPDFTIEAFYTQVKADLDAGNYTMAALDMRYNGGGSDSVITPTLMALAEAQRSGGLKVFCLIGEATFSSAMINSMMMKDMGAILIGAPTGGSVNHFGSTGSFTLPLSGVRVISSTKMIDIAAYFESGHGYGIEELKPDYPVVETLEDYLNGVDTTVEYILANGETLTLPDNSANGLTRGRFLSMLYDIAKENDKGGEAGQSEFADVFPFSETTPGVEWAVASGIAGGISADSFLPARLITKEEAAVFLTRFADYLGVNPIQTENITEPEDKDEISSWALESVITAWNWQGFNNGKTFDPDETMTIGQGLELVNSLFN